MHTARTSCGACCLRVNNVSVSREGMYILENVNLHIHCGEITCIIGPNGAGKTTLFETLLGVAKYTGQITYTDAGTGRKRTPRFGYVPQSLAMERLAPTTVIDFMRLGMDRRSVFLPSSHKTKDEALNALANVGAANLWDRRIGALSGGEIQRVALALALTPKPDVLLLDEPSSGIDADGVSMFYDIVSGLRRRMDMSVMIITHDFNMAAEYADKVVLLSRTILAQGDFAQVVRCDAFSRVFPNIAKAGGL